jgi:hypothetical protein
MSKQFTVDDIVEVTKAAQMMGVEAVWCTILFKGCKNPVKFYASPHIAETPFQREMYERLKSGQFGTVKEGIGEWYITIPPNQSALEEAAIATRNQLLLESDYTEFPSTQARFTDEQKTAWATYRQALRDITSQEGFPWDPEWPVKP